jgi:hypothetical protein
MNEEMRHNFLYIDVWIKTDAKDAVIVCRMMLFEDALRSKPSNAK